MALPDSRVFALVVAYQPQVDELARLLTATASQVSRGVIVHNGTPSQWPLADDETRRHGFAVRHLGDNLGVSAALNAGMDWALGEDASHVLLLDQDSAPAADMVARLLLALQQTETSGQRVAAVGPQSIDPRSGRRSAFLAPIEGRRTRLVPHDGEAVVVDHLITSGCLVPAHAWGPATRFREDFFIDYVDVEWCLRLRHAGWALLGVGGATLNHHLGDSVHTWGRRQVAQHSPARHYTLMRNGRVMQSLPHVSRGWKRSDALQLALKFVYFTLFARPRLAHLRAMWRGLGDGRRGRMGPAPKDV